MANSIDKYLKEYGLKETWKSLLFNLTKDQRIEHNENISENLLENKNFYEISDLYEYSLAFIDKLMKRKSGQYYTPEDICQFMAKEINNFEDGIWCDPCCGIGNLSYEILKIKPEMINTMQFFDIDETALYICRVLMAYFFDVDFESIKHNFHNCSFLEKNEVDYNFIIMNPPYCGKEKGEDLYISFMKKASEADGYISITPQSFTNSTSKECIELKNKISNFNYFKIYCFDNVPGNIFCGKKKGIFNSNTSNSVRAAITVCRKNEEANLITPLLRWKTEERKELLNSADTFLVSSKKIYQKKKFLKLFKDTEDLLDYGDKELRQLLSKNKTNYVLYVPSTPRYYITASKRKLNRSSYHELYFNNEQDLNLAYLILNSSYAYWWWRIADGGMTLSAEVLKNVRVDTSLVLNQNLIAELEQEENTCLVSKVNAGKVNENIKHSEGLISRIDNFLGFDKISYIKDNSYV